MRGHARIRKEAYTYKGKKRLTSAWYVNITDFTGRFHAIPGYRDKGATFLLGQIVEQLDIAREASMEPDPALMKRVRSLSEKHQRHLSKRGFISKSSTVAVISLSEYIERWVGYLKNTQTSEGYTSQAPGRVRRLFAGCGFKRIEDIERSKVQEWIHGRIEAGNTSDTLATYIRSIKTFCNWLVQEEIIESSPLKHLKLTLRVPTPRKIIRRALSLDHQAHLIKTAEMSPDVCRSMAGKDRAILYRVALETGLRWTELYSLNISSFQLEGDLPTVTVLAAHSKRRREDVLPLRGAMVEKLKEYFSHRNKEEKAFVGMLRDKGAKMLRFDLDNAGIPVKTEEGEVDFHALRHSFITNLTRAGVQPKMAQVLARHSNVELTLGRYSHVELREQADTLERTFS